MTNTTPKACPVEQVDRDAAADFMFECSPYLSDCGMKASVELALRQAFARHRVRTLPPAAEVMERDKAGPLDRCARCGARHIEHDRDGDEYPCPDAAGVFSPLTDAGDAGEKG